MFTAKLPGVSGVFRIMLMAVMLAVSAGCQLLASDEITAGSVIKFGRYPQTESGEIKPIEWRVMRIKGNKALLLAEKGLDVVPYNTVNQDVTWETSSIRQWLNTDFYNAAFNDSEKSRIDIALLNNTDNPEFGNDGGQNTWDQIFLLSYDEVNCYLPISIGIYTHRQINCYQPDRMLRTPNVRIGYLKPTPFAVKKGAIITHNNKQMTFWWLRTPGYYQNKATCVGEYPDYYGEKVNNGDNTLVRPALWMVLEPSNQ